MVQLSEMVRDDGVRVVSVVGELDLAEVEQFMAFGRRSGHGCAGLEVDLGGLSFIDSTGLSALIQLRKEFSELGLPLRLTNVGPVTRRLFHITGLLDVFGIGANKT